MGFISFSLRGEKPFYPGSAVVASMGEEAVERVLLRFYLDPFHREESSVELEVRAEGFDVEEVLRHVFEAGAGCEVRPTEEDVYMICCGENEMLVEVERLKRLPEL